METPLPMFTKIAKSTKIGTLMSHVGFLIMINEMKIKMINNILLNNNNNRSFCANDKISMLYSIACITIGWNLEEADNVLFFF